MYYISQSLEVNGDSKQVVFEVDSNSYLDIVDYVNNIISELVIKQAEMKLDVVLNFLGNKNLVRLYMPMRQNYKVGYNNDDEFAMLRPVYAVPGAKFNIAVRK